MRKAMFMLAMLAGFMLLAGRPAGAMFFDVIDDQVIVSGEVQLGDYERLVSRLNESGGKITTVVLRNSPGGLVQPMWNMMRLIRERNLRTVVSGYCVSACAHLFIAGAKRQFSDVEGSFVGFHGVYDSNTGIINISGADTQKQLILGYSQGSIDPALIDRWTYIRNRRGFMAFFDPDKLNRSDKASIFVCEGDENARSIPDIISKCGKIDGKDAFDSGMATSREKVAVNKR